MGGKCGTIGKKGAAALDILKLSYFIEAAACGSFTEAARRLFTSQPNISKQISALERETGVRLFERGGRSVTLTPAGRYLYGQLKDIPGYVRRSCDQARAMESSSGSRIRLGILEGQEISERLRQRLKRFSEVRPGAELEISRDGFRNLRLGLERGSYDMIITLSFELDALKNVAFQVIFSQEGMLAVHRSNPLSELSEITLDQLRDEDFVAISPEESPLGYAQLIRHCEKSGFEPRVVRLASSLESLLLCVEANMGVTVMDANTRLSFASDVRIIPVPGSESSDLVAVWRRERAGSIFAELAAVLSGDG